MNDSPNAPHTIKGEIHPSPTPSPRKARVMRFQNCHWRIGDRQAHSSACRRFFIDFDFRDVSSPSTPNPNLRAPKGGWIGVEVFR
ncbi:hypothetical protein CDAR_384991 [Caerostris darwini]|uniref:Uncharacterized protein n=1 Tax=Caerostris darwini TaxID=1538125 RepID=A0AAV4WBE8_9ARAC|nr:hypothetical protein CDAR_384991 [Caerostris darwini]